MEEHDAHDENEGQYFGSNFILRNGIFFRALGTAVALQNFMPQLT